MRRIMQLALTIPLLVSVFGIPSTATAATNSMKVHFINVVKPKQAVISVGKNAYGHPTKDVLNRFKKVKATVYRTDPKGNIIFTSTGTKITVATKR